MGAQTGITFDRFVRACVVIKSLTEGFQRFDTVSVLEDVRCVTVKQGPH